MATSCSTSSDESNGAPTDFNVSSSLESSNGRSSVISERCPVCSQYRRVFYCQECIHNGDFTHSKAKFPERYAEKKLCLVRLERQKAALEESIEKKVGGRLKKGCRQQDVKETRERLQLLRLALEEVRARRAQELATVERLRSECQQKRAVLEAFPGRLERGRRQAEKLRAAGVERRDGLAGCRRRLKDVVRRNLGDLTRYIFPIREHAPLPSVTAEGDLCVPRLETEDPVRSALQEAQQTTYVRGRWVTLAAPPPGATYSIVEPRLPAHGDYSQYCSWVLQRQECSSPADDPRNVGYTLSAGLALTAQLVSVLSFYLDVCLPHHVHYREFGGGELSEEAFKHKVAKLNANVIHLCASQGVDPLHLRPRATLRNLLLLLDPATSDLGRAEAFELSPELSVSVEDSLSRDLALSAEDSSEDSEDGVGEDWESISNFSPGSPEFPRGAYSTTTAMSRQTSPPQQTASLFSSAAALVTNFWKPAHK